MTRSALPRAPHWLMWNTDFDRGVGSIRQYYQFNAIGVVPNAYTYLAPGGGHLAVDEAHVRHAHRVHLAREHAVSAIQQLILVLFYSTSILRVGEAPVRGSFECNICTYISPSSQCLLCKLEQEKQLFGQSFTGENSWILRHLATTWYIYICQGNRTQCH